MLRLTRSTVYPIGLDIGHESVKLLQLGRAGDSLSVVACAQSAVVVSDGATPEERSKATIEAIRQALRRGSFHGRKAVAALPRELVHVRNLRLPPMPASELPGIVRFEAKNVLPFDTSEATIEFLPAGEVRQGSDLRQEVIVLGTKNHDLDQYVELISQGGMMLEALDIQPCALYRTVDRFVRRREDEHEVNVLVDVGAQRSQVVIGKGKDINFIKLIDIGGRHFLNSVSRKLGINVEEAHSLRRRLAETPIAESAGAATERDPVRQAANDATRALMEELGREIALCLRYYSVTFRGQRPMKVRVVGGEAHDPQLLAVLNRVLPIPAEIGRALLSVDTSRMSIEDRSGPMTHWTVALGLALKCIEGSFGARDGKPRTATREEAAIAAQLSDIHSGLRAAGAATTESPAETSTNHERDAFFASASASFAAKPPSRIAPLPAQPAREPIDAKTEAFPALAATAPIQVELPTSPRQESPPPSDPPKAMPPSTSSKWRVLAPNGIEPPAVPIEQMPVAEISDSTLQQPTALEASHA